MRRGLSCLLAAACCAFGTGTAAALPSPPGPPESRRVGLGVKLLEAPIDRRQDPRASSYIIDHLPPGTVIHRNILVVNESPKPLRVTLYPGAAAIRGGTFTFAPAGKRNELAGWISLARTGLRLEPWQETSVPATIRVPRTASAGERYAVIWAQHHSKPGPGGNVGLITRAGVRVYLDIGPGGELPSSFRISRLVPARSQDGRPQLRVRVHNTGARAVDISGSLRLRKGPDGLTAGPFTNDRVLTLAPRHKGTLVFTLGKSVPKGPWKAEVTLRSGMLRQTAGGRIKFPDTGTGRPVLAVLTSPGSSPLLWITIALLAAGPLAYAVRRRLIRKR
ncbi:peptidase [Streptomyces sp. NPDC092370]|uniref:peptidase n=1 Tax=Streptomyces sp. NPDC092370 TaxID=3366016 RepID=UPI0037FCB1B0